MNLSQLFLQRYDALYNFWIAEIWTVVPDDLMRQRPDPRINSIAWNLWHLTRVEDAGLNRFVADFPQVMDEGQWQQRMNLPWRYNGYDMTLNEVDQLNQNIDLQALHGYSDAVQARTRQVIQRLNFDDLDAVMEEPRLRLILFEEGLAHSTAGGLLKNYMGWTKGKCLMNFCMTHPYQHIGEIGVIASLLDVDFG